MVKNCSRREAIKLLGTIAAGAAAGLPLTVNGCSLMKDKKEYPNVVLISIDTLRPDHLSCYGYFRKTSPNIDRLAEESLVFTHAYSAAPMTMSSHMAMFTSVTPSVHGVTFVNDDTYCVLPESIKTLPEILRSSGFTNYGYVNNYYQLDAKYGFGRGFPNRYDVGKDKEPGYYGYRKAHLFEEHRYELKGNEPIFLFYHTFKVHCSELDAWPYIYDGPPEYRDRFLPNGKAVPFNHSMADVYVGKERINSKELEEIIARYDGGILDADNEIKELLEMLKEEGLYDDSLIVFTADHGEPLGDIETGNGAPILNGHGGLRNVGLHVPLMIKFPKGFEYNGPTTGKIDSQVRTIDIFPTILDILSIDPPPYIEGKSLLKINGDRTSVGVIYGDYSFRTPDFNVIFRSSKDFHSFDDDFSEVTGVQIYDVKSDPAEHNNIFERGDAKSEELLKQAEEAQKKELSLRKTLVSSEQQTGVLDENTKKGLKALGYLGN